MLVASPSQPSTSPHPEPSRSAAAMTSDPITNTDPSTAYSIVPTIIPSDSALPLPETAHSHIWIITGPAGCGKSTVASYLASTWGMPYLEGDSVRLLSSSSPFFSLFQSLLPLILFLPVSGSFTDTNPSSTHPRTSKRWLPATL